MVTTLLLRGASRRRANYAAGRSGCVRFSVIWRKWKACWKGLTTLPKMAPLRRPVAPEPGKRESRYMHLFCDDMDTLITTVEALAPLDDDGDLRARVEALEGGVAG